MQLDDKKLHEIINEQYEYAQLELSEKDHYAIINPFDTFSAEEWQNPQACTMSILMDPSYFGWTCKVLFGIDLFPIQCVALKQLWYSQFPMFVANRGFGKSFLLAIYSLLRALFLPGRKVVLTGAGFRQSKIIFGYIEKIWDESPILRDIAGSETVKNSGPRHGTDVWEFIIGPSSIKALPMGPSGDKIRGQRANDIIADEFSVINPMVFEEVVVGFGIVKQDPQISVKYKARQKLAIKHKNNTFWNPANLQSETEDGVVPNQTVVSGTASYTFNHFYDYWRRYRDTIKSGGDPDKLAMAGIDPRLDYKKFLIMRFPYNVLPEGYIEDQQLERSRNNMTVAIFQNEFGAVFSGDSNGFYRRRLIETCVIGPRNPITIEGVPVDIFYGMTKGYKDRNYIFAIDTAAMKDRFALVILEVHPDHARVVYCWTTNKEDQLAHAAKVKSGSKGSTIELERDYYSYCIRKIRDLMKIFNCIHIALDSQGGGRTISEGLQDPNRLEEGEELIFPCDSTNPLWDGKKRETDDERGLHILELVNFRDSKYTSEANHGMKYDFEKQLLLFPYYDDILNILDQYGEKYDFNDDTLDNVLTEIEAIKDELSAVKMEVSQISHTEKWFVPSVKTAGSDEVAVHDDRFSALVMANSAARRLRMKHEAVVPQTVGGYVGQRILSSAKDQPLYIGAAWVTEQLRTAGSYGSVVKRGN